jgi:hypothetical protein
MNNIKGKGVDTSCTYCKNGYCRLTFNYKGEGFTIVKDVENGSLSGYACNTGSSTCLKEVINNEKI